MLHILVHRGVRDNSHQRTWLYSSEPTSLLQPPLVRLSSHHPQSHQLSLTHLPRRASRLICNPVCSIHHCLLIVKIIVKVQCKHLTSPDTTTPHHQIVPILPSQRQNEFHDVLGLPYVFAHPLIEGHEQGCVTVDNVNVEVVEVVPYSNGFLSYPAAGREQCGLLELFADDELALLGQAVLVNLDSQFWWQAEEPRGCLFEKVWKCRVACLVLKLFLSTG